jgi:hypothetical protein
MKIGHYSVLPDGSVISLRRGTKLSPVGVYGYHRVKLYQKKGVPTRAAIHRLVAEAFIPNPKGLPFVNHKNGKKWDNRVENLEWCDHAGNIQHACDTGLITHARGSAHGRAKLTENDVLGILALTREGRSDRSIGVQFGVSRATVEQIRRRKIWKHVGGY